VLEGSEYALEPAREFGCRRIIKRFNKIRKIGLEIGKGTPAKQVHEFRIEVKKLRYLMECFHPVFDPEEIAKVRSELKTVQDELGTYQDAEVQVAKLVQLAGDLQGSGSGLEPILALGQLIGIYEKEIRQCRKRSLKVVRWLTGDPAAREFQSCFKYPVE
jgi:CHAD domain-containing protein